MIRDRAWTTAEQRFADYALEHGWELFESWVPEVEYEGEPIGGYWQIAIRKEKPLPDGRIYGQFLDIPTAIFDGYEKAWGHLIQLAEMALERGMEEAHEHAAT